VSKARNIANTDSFTVVTLTGGSKTATLSREFPPGTYSIESVNTDNDLEIYLGSTAGANVGYVTGGAKAITASASFRYVTTNNANSSDAIIFSFLSEAQNLTTKTDAYWAPPTITTISPSSLPIVDDTATITGTNFPSDVTVKFRKSDDSTLVNPKSTVRGSATSIIVTRPDTFATGDSPYDLIVTNPTTTLSTTLSNGVTAGSNPTWVTSATLNNATKNSAFSQTISATDPDGGTVSYSVVSGAFPTSITLNSSTGVISGTTADNAASYSIIIAATDSGGNATNRTFTMQTLTVPSAPTIGAVTLLSSSSASVTFTAPASNGNSAITSYTVTSSTGSFTGTGSSSPITVSGLAAGTSYTFTVTATNSVGTSSASSASSSVTTPKATGGTFVNSGGYTYHVFSSSGTFTPVVAGLTSVQVLNIAGGGAGGNGAGGGGAGAGGLTYSASYAVSNGVGVTATIGAGATGLAGQGSGGGPTAQNGSNSVFGSNTATGGGAGGARLGAGDSTAAGKNGGSGGGASYNNPGTVGTGSQGFNGGAAYSGDPYYSGGGGGGSGAVGGTASTTANTNAGGAGTNTYSAWLSAVSPLMSGITGWSTATSGGRIAGGGGGGGLDGYALAFGGTGGLGGGGDGGKLSTSQATLTSTSGITNTGSGGGAPANGSQAGNGGAGIIIVRYA